MGDGRASLRRELLLNLALLVAAAVALAMATALIAQILAPTYTFVLLIALIVLDAAIVFAFGHYLLRRLVLRPMTALRDVAEALSAGNLAPRAPPAETREFTELGDCFNRMTERLLDAQSQLIRSEKLATVGRLAAGIAHEVGNPLSAVQTYVEVLGKRGAAPDLVPAITRETDRINRIVRGLLDYAHPGNDRVGTVDLREVVCTIRDLLEQQGALNEAEVRTELGPDALPVRGWAHALEQVVINLVLNAVDASPKGPIVVGAMRTSFDPRSVIARRSTDWIDERQPERLGRRAPIPGSRRPWRPDIEPGAPGVLLYVADGGPGVPIEDRDKIFDPFYTTKPPGEGTGLGLAIVERNVHELGGVVWVEDAREGGAAFKVFLLPP